MVIPAQSSTRLWIGPSGWSYPDWYGVVYPARAPQGFKPLAHVARYFNAVEVNSSFYGVPKPATTATWPAQTPADFRFAFKIPRALTHESVVDPDRTIVEDMKLALRPILDSGKLGPLLLQYPWSFHFNEHNADRLKRLLGAFAEYRCISEVRHTSWLQPAALKLLGELGGMASIDQPMLRACIGPREQSLGDTAYVRLHGRNKQNWFATGLPSYARYDYLYSEDELREWVGRIHGMLEHSREVYVFANNHYRGQAFANAAQLKSLLGLPDVRVPEQLGLAFPALAPFSDAPLAPGLFD